MKQATEVCLGACLLLIGLPIAQAQASGVRVHAGSDAEVAVAAAGASLTSSGAFKVVHTPVKQQEYRELQEALQEAELLETIADDLNESIALPFDITVTFEECGQVNAFYDPEARKISMCLELIEDLNKVFEARTDSEEEAAEATINATVFILYHEVGHALVDALELPVTGKEEDAVDQLSTYVLADGTDEGETAALDGAAAFVSDEEDVENLAFWDEHSLGPQRFYNIICWVYGSNPEKYADLVGDENLPADRAERCPAEYAQMDRSWSTLLAPHVKE